MIFQEDALANSSMAGLGAELRSDWKIVGAIAAISLAVHLVLWVGWPLYSIRALGISEINFYVNAFELKQPTDYNLLAYAQPLPPLFHALTLMISPLANAIAQTILAVVSVLIVYLIVRPWGRLAAGAAAGLYLLDLPLQLLFHEVSSEGLSMWFFLALVLALRYAIQQLKFTAWAMYGLLVALGALSRPAMLGFLVLAVCLIFVNLTLKRKLMLASVMVAASVAVITPWIVYKGARFNLWSFTRPNVDLVFFSTRYFHLVHPENGPASQELADLLNEHVISLPSYTQNQITLDRVLNTFTPPGEENSPFGPNRFMQDVPNVVDKYKGWDTNYRLLNQVGMEAIRANPRGYVEAYLASLGVVLFEYDEFTIPEPRVYDIFVRAPYQVPAMSRTAISHPNNVPDPTTAALEARADRIRQIFGSVIEARGNGPLAAGIIQFWKTIWPPMALFYLLLLVGLLNHKRLSLLYWLGTSAAAAGLVGLSVLAGPLPRYRLPMEPMAIVGAAIGMRFVTVTVYQLVSQGLSKLRHRGDPAQS